MKFVKKIVLCGCIFLIILPQILAEENFTKNGNLYLFPWQFHNLIREKNHDIDTLNYNFIFDFGNGFTLQSFEDIHPFNQPRFMLSSCLFQHRFTTAIGLLLLPVASARFVEEYREFLRETRILREDNPLLWHQLLHGRNQTPEDPWEALTRRRERENEESRRDVFNRR